MNHIYKTVWNKSKNMFVVTSELASSNGRSATEKKASASNGQSAFSIFAASMTALASMLYLQSVIAADTIATGTTLVHNANNGVQIIDIAAANQAGVSHNRFVKYNVDQNGQILNNAAMDVKNLSVMTGLAGKIHTNANLKESARLILNEVTGTERSALNGFVEVAGKKADVVLANPYGITCTGCGFINTDQAVLTTGKPNIGADGQLNSFDIRRGDININQNGLDASQQDLLKLISRELYLNGQVNAKNLEIVTGTNLYNFNTGEVNRLTSEEEKPTFAIDSTALGGIYANKISILATEQGVGVRMAGDVAANTDEFVLTSAGKIELKNQIGAKTELQIQNYQNENIGLNIEGRLKAAQINLGQQKNSQLDVSLQNADIYAEQAVKVFANNLESNAKTSKTKIQAKNTVALSVNEHTNLKNTTITADQGLSIDSGRLKMDSSDFNTQAQLTFTAQDQMVIGDGTVIQSGQDSKISAKTGDLDIQKAKMTSQAMLDLQSKGRLNVEASELTAGADIKATAQNIILDVTTNADNTYFTAADEVKFSANANVVSQKSSKIKAKNVDIHGKMNATDTTIETQTLTGHLETTKVISQNVLDVQATNAEVFGTWGAKTISLDVVEALKQNGTLFSTENTEIIAKEIELLGNNSARNMQIYAEEQLKQTFGQISVEAQLKIFTKNMQQSADIIAQNININAQDLLQQGYLAATEDLNIRSDQARLTNHTLANNIDIQAKQQFENTGNLLANSKLNIQSARVLLNDQQDKRVASAEITVEAEKIEQHQSSLIEAANHLSLHANDMDFKGSINANAADFQAEKTLTAAGSMDVYQGLSMNAQDLDLSGKLIASKINLTAKNSLQSIASMQAMDTFDVKAASAQLNGLIFAESATVSVSETLNQLGKLYITERLNLDALNLWQNGIIHSNSVNMTVSQKLSQNAGAVLVAESAGLNAENIELKGALIADNLQANAGKNITLQGQIQTAKSTKVDANMVNLNGLMISDDLEITAKEKIDQTQGSIIKADGTAQLNSAKNLQVAGEILAKNVALDADTLVHDANVQAYDSININVKDARLTSKSKTLANKNVAIQARQNIDIEALDADNKAFVYANNTLNLQAKGKANLSGALTAQNVNLRAQQKLSTGALSEIQAHDKIALQSISDDVQLSGDLYANRYDISALNNIVVQNDASIKALEKLNLTANKVENYGWINSNADTVLNIDHLLNAGEWSSNSFSQLRNSTGVLSPQIYLGSFENQQSFFSNSSLNIQADHFNNAKDAELFTNSDLTIQTQDFVNSGDLIALDQVDIDVIDQNITNNGKIVGLNQVDLSAKGVVNNQTINSKKIVIQSDSTLRNTGNLVANDQMKLSAQSTLSNSGNIVTLSQSPDSALSIQSNVLENQKGGYLSSKNIYIDANSINNYSDIESDTLLLNASKKTDVDLNNNAGANIYTASIQTQYLNALNNAGGFYVVGGNGSAASNLNVKKLSNLIGSDTYLSNLNLTVSDVLQNASEFYANHVTATVKSLKNSDSNISSEFYNDAAKITLNDASKFTVTEAYDHLGTLTLNNTSEAQLSSLNNHGLVELSGSQLKVSNNLVNNKTIKGAGESRVSANLIDNYSLMNSTVGSKLSIVAKTINNLNNAAILALGDLSINGNETTATTQLINKGRINSAGDLTIGNAKKGVNLSNLMYTTSGDTAKGGLISSKGNMNIYANNFTNNSQIISNADRSKAFNINVTGNFKNETTYHDQVINLIKKWSYDDSTFQLSNSSWDSKTINSNIRYIRDAVSGGGDGIDSALVTELWKLTVSDSSTFNSDGTLNQSKYQQLSNYLTNANNLAQIRSNAANLVINFGSKNAINKGAKIVSGGNLSINGTGDFSNQSLDIYKNKPYELQYRYMTDEYDTVAIMYKKDTEGANWPEKGGKGSDLDSDGGYEKVWNYTPKLDGNDNISYIRHDRQEGNYQERLKDFRKKVANEATLKAFVQKDDATAQSTASAVIYSAKSTNVTAKNLYNGAIELDKQNNKNQNIGSDSPTTQSGDPECNECNAITVTEKTPDQVNGSNDLKAETLDSKALDDSSQSIAEADLTESDAKVDADVEAEDQLVTAVTEVAKPAVVLPKINNDYPLDKIPKINIVLPDVTDEFGPFLLNPKSNAEYLIESNPLYGDTADVLGSNYLRDQLGITPDQTVKRLGDANYEQELVRQQVEQVLNRGVVNNTIMQSYFDNAIGASQALGLTYGQPLTAEQIQRLDKDIVWMVEQVLNGQKVLVPQVYLGYSTLSKLNSDGSVIEGEEGVNLDVESLVNKEATISGGNVVVKSQKDIDNFGAQIKGKNVALTSVEGSINNITQTRSFGNDTNDRTYIGPTAGISSENTLVLDAGKDINITGAKVKAGGDAVFEAGGDINITTIQDKNASTTRSGNTTTNVKSTTHIGSEIDIGGNAYLKSGNDTVISGSEFNVAGGFAAETGGDFRLESVQDTVETTTTSSKSGFGVGGGLWGTQTTETNEFEGKNKASNLNVGGAVDILAANKVVIEGSELNIGSDGVSRIEGVKGVDILDGKDEYRSQTTVKTTTFLKLEGGDTGASAQSGASANSSKNELSAEAKAGASAEAHASGSLKLMETSVEVQTDTETNSVASKINSKGSLVIKSSEGDVHVRGSEVNVDQALAVKAKNVILEAGKNEKTSTNTKDSQSIGIYGEASASADAGASASANINGVSAQAEANVNADATLTLGAKSESSYSSTKEISHNKAKLNSGTDMVIEAEETLLSQGVSANAGGNMSLQAKDIINKAVTDSKETTTSQQSTLVGFYVGASASANASANAGAGVNGSTMLQPIPSASAEAKAGASAGVEVSAGLRTLNTSDASYSLTTTNQGNDFSATGNMSRIATNTILDQGTNIDVGVGFKQKATNVIDQAVHDVNIQTSSSSSQDIRVGAYVGAGAEASAEANAAATPFGSSAESKKGAEANGWSGGVKASYDGESISSSSYTATAVTTRINAQSIDSDVSGHMELNGATYSGTEAVNLKAQSANFNEAVSYSNSNKSSSSLNAEVKVGLVPSSPSLEMGVSQGTESQSQNTATGVGSTFSGNKVNIVVSDTLQETGMKVQANESNVSANKQNSKVTTQRSEESSSSTGWSVGFKASSSEAELSISEK